MHTNTKFKKTVLIIGVLLIVMAVIVLCNHLIKQIIHHSYASQVESYLSDSEKSKNVSIDCILSQSGNSDGFSLTGEACKQLLSDLKIKKIGFDDYPQNTVLLIVATYLEDGENESDSIHIVASASGELYITFHDYRYWGYSENLSKYIQSQMN